MARKVREMEKQMHKHASNLEFEEAAKIRDQIKHLREKGLAA
jgi:excinuclease ABC subunit B